MPHINMEKREISFKIVYYGPGMSGKTTNLAYIHRAIADSVRGDMLTLDTAEERTLFFDYFPLNLGRIAGFAIKFNMYTVPGQIYYEASRRLILDGADGVVFVADSQPEQLKNNIVSYRLMENNLRSYDLDPETFPTTLQYNKRDCEDPLPLGSLEKHLSLRAMPVFEAVATEGKGVMKTIHTLSRLVIERFQF